MFDDKTRKFNFKCEKCKGIMFSEFENEEDIRDVLEGRIWLECIECEGKAKLLSN